MQIQDDILVDSNIIKESLRKYIEPNIDPNCIERLIYSAV